MAETTAPSPQAVLDAFNAHDVDAILSFFTEDCVLDTPRGQRLVCSIDGKISRKDSFWKIVD
jgi:hypothetical protein